MDAGKYRNLLFLLKVRAFFPVHHCTHVKVNSPATTGHMMLRTAIGSRVLVAALGLTAALIATDALTQNTSQGVPKQVHLVVDGNRLVASNVRIRESAEGEAVLLIVTSQRIIAYGLLSGWREIDLVPNERIERVTAEDFAGLVVTSERLLNFNGESGTWGERERRVHQ
jgi:hypothetical protein